MIGDDVTITVLGVKGNQVRVGINAPKHIGVHREEIYQRIHAEKLANVSQAGNGNTKTTASSARPAAETRPEIVN